MAVSDVSLAQVFGPDHVIRDLAARDKKTVVKEMIQFLVDQDRLPSDAVKKAERAVHKRESMGTTGIGKGLGIPHAKECSFVDEVVGVFARSVEGIAFESVDGGLVHVLFLVLSPAKMASQHLEIMKRIALLHRDEKTLQYLARDAKLASLEAIFSEVDDEFSRSTAST